MLGDETLHNNENKGTTLIIDSISYNLDIDRLHFENDVVYIDMNYLNELPYNLRYDERNKVLYIQKDEQVINNKNNMYAMDIDTDMDGLSDFSEIHKYNTNPYKADSDEDGILDSEWQERKEYTYSLTCIMKISKPWNVDYMNDDYQDIRIIDINKDVLTVEVVVYPYNTVKEGIIDKGNDKTYLYNDYSFIKEYLVPGVTTNWDKNMQQDLKDELVRTSIQVDNVSDKELITSVSKWIWQNTHQMSNAWPLAFFTYYPNGKTEVYPDLEKHFTLNKKKFNDQWTDEEAFERLVLGRSMYYTKIRGTCTSSATLQATILRSLGVPARIICTIPIYDINDNEQVDLINNIKNIEVKNWIIDNSVKSSFSDHFFNEVYVDDRWVRLNYDRYAANISLDSSLGLVIHVNTMADISEIPMAETWGKRAMNMVDDEFPSRNPYMLTDLYDEYGDHMKKRNVLISENALKSKSYFFPYNSGEKKDVDIDLVDWVENMDYINSYYKLIEIKKKASDNSKKAICNYEKYTPNGGDLFVRISNKNMVDITIADLIEYQIEEGKIQLILDDGVDKIYTDRVKGYFDEEVDGKRYIGFILGLSPNSARKVKGNQDYTIKQVNFNKVISFGMENTIKGKIFKVEEDDEEPYKIETVIIGTMRTSLVCMDAFNFNGPLGLSEDRANADDCTAETISYLNSLDVFYLYTMGQSGDRLRELFPEIDDVKPGDVLVKIQNKRHVVLIVAEDDEGLINLIKTLPKSIEGLVDKYK